MGRDEELGRGDNVEPREFGAPHDAEALPGGQEQLPAKPVLLLILDGWGLASKESGGPQNSAVELAHTPVWDHLWKSGLFPTTRLIPHGALVGLTPGQMGNSEVGHLNIGAGRIVYQDLVAITRMIQYGEFARHKALNAFLHTCWESGAALHFIGLFSDGGVHSHIDHLYGLIEYACHRGVRKFWIHALLDGRDTPPRQAEQYFEQAEDWLPACAGFATLGGRYFGMDRDRRWDRVQLAWEAIAHGVGADGVRPSGGSLDRGQTPSAPTWQQALAAARARDEGDEFVTPTVLDGYPGIADGDHVLFFNFRADRMRQLVSCFTKPAQSELHAAMAAATEENESSVPAPKSDLDAPGFDRGRIPRVEVMSATHYRADFTFPVLLDGDTVAEGLVEIVSRHKLATYKLAETEKYAHVTYFFNGGREEPWPGEERVLVASPKVATYDLQPQMSLPEVTARLVLALRERRHSLFVVNFANPDMVGHTGVKAACIRACEAVDAALQEVMEAAEWGERVACIVTADHGNCDQLTWPDGSPHTQHSMNDVPVVVVGAPAGMKLRQPGLLQDAYHHDRANLALCDLAPTVLALLGIAQPESWTGVSLLL
jgi:2,3-bisphosphoglycerate-independent phosphoglycerate mutase